MMDEWQAFKEQERLRKRARDKFRRAAQAHDKLLAVGSLQIAVESKPWEGKAGNDFKGFTWGT
ncbi:MAG: hypothetical protein LBP75_07110 [Planctomycetota bacterium]|jgi:hypothetical protein|nr:hypothetical protein [Planctomycetota bacterium]